MRLVTLCLFALAAFNVGATPQNAIDAANGPACAVQAPFFWEVGDASGAIVGGTVGGTTYTAETPIVIASASKFYYSAFVQQLRGGVLNEPDVKYMTFRSGYGDPAACRAFDTVGTCAARAPFDPAAENLFDYGGGHMQKHAAANGFASMNAAAFTSVVNSMLGTNVQYTSPQPAGGITTTPAETAAFLRAVMSGRLVLGAHLGDSKVCTKCAEAIGSPIPEPWFYSVGHWVELDGTFSSPGAFGYYPWISADKSLYGIVARRTAVGAWGSVQCGRAIRSAFLRQ
jgi:hypothetical protein